MGNGVGSWAGNTGVAASSQQYVGGGGVKWGKQRPPLEFEAGTAEVGEADPPERQEKRKGARASQQGRSNGRSVGARRLAQHSGRR